MPRSPRELMILLLLTCFGGAAFTAGITCGKQSRGTAALTA